MASFKAKTALPGHHLVSIIQVANHTLKEMYIDVTDMLFHELIDAHKRNPPNSMRHWRGEHHIEYISLAYSIPLADTAPFIEKCVEGLRSEGWTVLR